MLQSDTITELAKALAKAQSQIENAKQDAQNPHLGKKYANLTSVWEAARKPLTDNGLSVVQGPGRLEENKIELTTRLMHSSGEWLESTITLPVSKLDAQQCGSALTYARRYALSAMVGICPDDDDDGHSHSQPQQRRDNNRQQDQRGQERSRQAVERQERPFQPVSQPKPAPTPESRGDAAAQPTLTEAPAQGREPVLCCAKHGCGQLLTKGQFDLSKAKYGEPLCLHHQKESGPMGDGNPTPGYAR